MTYVLHVTFAAAQMTSFASYRQQRIVVPMLALRLKYFYILHYESDRAKGGTWIRPIPGEERGEVREGLYWPEPVHFPPQVSGYVAVRYGDE